MAQNSLKPTIPNWQLYSLMMGMLITGAIDTLVVKYQDQQVVRVTDGKEEKFHHPYFQCFNMFCGEMICLIYYAIKVCYQNRAKQGLEAAATLNNKSAVDEMTPRSPGSTIAD